MANRFVGHVLQLAGLWDASSFGQTINLSLARSHHGSRKLNIHEPLVNLQLSKP
jgi:hypothetical protein